jgi:signal transduction histidine kinase
VYLEDDPDHVFLVDRSLRNHEIDAQLVHVQNREEFLQALDHRAPDVILSDHALPGFSYDSALSISRIRFPEIPFVVVSSSDDETQIAEVLNAGADGFVSKGELWRLYPLIRDRQSRKTMPPDIERENASLETEKKLASMSRDFKFFTQVVSDDLMAFKGHLQVYKGLLSAADSRDAGPSVMQFLGFVDAEVQKILERIQDLILVDANLDLQVHTVDLSELTRVLLNRIAPANSQTLVDLSLQPGIKVKGDPALLENMLKRLINNAWKYSLGRDPITIEFGALTSSGGILEYYLRDNGQGMNEQQIQELLAPQPEKERKRGKRGVGFAIARKIVEIHGGAIRVESDGFTGTTVYFSLPCN